MWKKFFLKRFVLFIGREITHFFFPGTGIVLTLLVTLLIHPQIAEAAGRTKGC